MRSTGLPLLIAFSLLAMSTDVASAFDDSPGETFTAIQKAVTDSKWGKLTEKMTPTAHKTVVQGLVFGAAAACERDFPPGRQGEEYRERIKQVLTKYGADSIKFPGAPKRPTINLDPESAAANREKRAKYTDQVLAVIKNRNEFLAELSDTMAKGPIPGGSTLPFRFGELTNIQLGNTSASATIEIDSARLSDDPSIVNVMPPVPVVFQLDNGRWKYHGIDEQKQREILEKHMNLHMRSEKPDEIDDLSLKQPPVTDAVTGLTLHAHWLPFDDDSTYGFAKKWPEINQMKPVAKTRDYSNSLFSSLLPPTNKNAVGKIWSIDPEIMLPLLKQFHDGASVKLHHGGPTGAFGCLIGQNDNLRHILIRLHGEIRHEDGWYYTVSQFEGDLIWDDQAKVAKSFRLRVPPVRTNVDVNRSMSYAEYQNRENVKGLMGVDIGFTPRMELVGGSEFSQLNWLESIDRELAKNQLSKRFYKSAQIDWLPFEEAVRESRETGKPLHVVALFGTLYDESC